MKIAALQLTSKLNPLENLEKISGYLKQAKGQKVEAVFLPECFYSMSNAKEPTPYLIENQNEHYQNIQRLAKDHQLYLLGGSAATKVENEIINRNYNFGPDGTLLQTYDKIHLFAVNLSNTRDKKVINEADIYTSGKTPAMLQVKHFKIGLSICFDLRFPEMFRNYAKSGAQVLSISSAFTVPTGKAHWHTLVRARAIENQCYVVASAQWGVHNEHISTYGHSLIVDPWGEVLADGKQAEGLIFAELSIERIKDIRSRMHVLRD